MLLAVRLSGVVMAAAVIVSCGGGNVAADTSDKASGAREIGVVKAVKKPLSRTLVVSSELIPFQQIDVFAKEAGFVRQLNVDYGTHVAAGQVMAVLEIPELQMQVDEDADEVKDAQSRISTAQRELDRVEAEHKVMHLQYTRLDQVAKSKAGLVAQQEVDDWQSKDLASEAQVEASRAAVESAQSELARAQARQRRDQVLFDYSKITAPFNGVVTKRYANLGTLMQAGTNSSTQAMALVQLSEDDKFRLVIPVSESYVRFVHVGDPVTVRVPALGRTFPGKVSRFSVDVEEDTRTMHTEVDVPNPKRVLMPGLYAEATLTLDRTTPVVTVPQEAVNIDGDKRSVWLVDPSNRVQLREIEAGIETPTEVEVLNGLEDGDMVAVGDRSSLKAGETIKPKLITLIEPPQE